MKNNMSEGRRLVRDPYGKETTEINQKSKCKYQNYILKCKIYFLLGIKPRADREFSLENIFEF
ncbi:MAG: hypothetical protein U9R01_09500 [candidate division WOR-3 bacterium]|nr:hypothetical protein [candidate division WOR-3 bacterium]